MSLTLPILFAAAAACFAGAAFSGPHLAPARPLAARRRARTLHRSLPVLAFGLLLGAPFDADAQSAPQQVAAATITPQDQNAAQYCRNIADAAADARFTRQKDALSAMEKAIEARVAQLEAKRREYEDWLQRREAFLKKADDALVAVISQMRPDAAAAQISAMNEEMAAALLSKLSPRVASAILNEIDPPRAARLTSTMVGLSQRNATGKAG